MEDQPLRFINDVEFFEDEILFTDSSSKWQRKDHTYILLEAAGDGRLLSLDRATGNIRVLMRGLNFANGLALAPDRHSVLVAETLMARIHQVYLSGELAGTSRIWVDNLPGFPDNIRLIRSSLVTDVNWMRMIRKATTGGFWIGFAAVRNPSFSSFIDQVQVRFSQLSVDSSKFIQCL